MGAFITAILSKLAAVVDWFGKLAVAVFVALWDLLKDGVCWMLEGVLEAAQSLVQSLDLSAFQQAAGAFGSIPANVLEVLSALGLGTAFSIIVAAIGVRFTLQLIPFTRLGS